MMILWGILSAQQGQRIAELAINDLDAYKRGNLNIEGLQGLAKLGSYGTHKNNCWRDLQTKLPKMHLPDPYQFMIPIQNKLLGCFKRPSFMLLPHELFSAIYEHYPDVWRSSVCPGGYHFEFHLFRFLQDFHVVAT